MNQKNITFILSIIAVFIATSALVIVGRDGVGGDANQVVETLQSVTKAKYEINTEEKDIDPALLLELQNIRLQEIAPSVTLSPQMVPVFEYQSLNAAATTTQFIGNIVAQDTSNVMRSKVITVYSDDVLLYSDATLGFSFGLPSLDKTIRIDDAGIYARRDDALVWIWFKKNFDVAVSNFFVIPTQATTTDALSFDYNFRGYPKFSGVLFDENIQVGLISGREVTVSYVSLSEGYSNVWKFVHFIRAGRLYTFGVQIEPKEVSNYQHAEQMISVFKNTFNFY